MTPILNEKHNTKKFLITQKKSGFTQVCLLRIRKAKCNYVVIMDEDLQHHTIHI
jgi:hypothetical protein